MPNTNENSSRLLYLDGIRAIAAVYVLIHHAVHEVWHNNRDLTGLARLIAAPFAYGHQAVVVFICLSGFCLMLPVVGNGGYAVRSYRKFVISRIRRIVPPFYGAVVVSAVLGLTLLRKPLGSFWDTSLPVTGYGLLANAAMLQNVFCVGKINYVFWSIAVEFQIYFFFPPLAAAFRWSPSGATLATGLASAFIFLIVRSNFLSGLTPQLFAVFCFGMLACHVSREPATRIAVWSVISGATFGGMTILIFLWRRDMTLLRLFSVDVLCGISMASLLVVLASRPTFWLRRCLGARPLTGIGKMSYSLYLLHAPLLALVWRFVLAPLSLPQIVGFVVLSSFGTVLIIAVAYGFYNVAEQPFITRRARLPH